MSLLNKPFDQITFEDVEDYCKEQHVETATLDYKQVIPRDLAKHIAAMSNTLGGIIIIGVEENRKTGLPTKWDGISPTDKPVERVHQFVANVKPYPSCNVRETNEKNGKIFVLVEVLEGDATPYYPVNDLTTVWLRTGNISTPLKPAERDAVEIMFGKRAKAEAARESNLARAEALTSGASLLTPRSVSQLVKALSTPSSYSGLGGALRGDVIALVLQPYFPRRELLNPRAIRERIHNFRSIGGAGFPYPQLRAGPNCIYYFGRGHQESGRCDQVHSNGLLYHAREGVLRAGEGETQLFISHVSESLYVFLKTAQAFYRAVNYHGLLEGRIALLNVREALVRRIIPQGYRDPFDDEPCKIPLPNYEWPLELDTHKLADSAWLQDYFVSLMERIYWDLGLDDRNAADMIKVWLQQTGRIVQ